LTCHEVWSISDRLFKSWSKDNFESHFDPCNDSKQFNAIFNAPFALLPRPLV